MWNEGWAVYLVQNFMPLNAELIIVNKPYKRFAIELGDFDYDGWPEIIAKYKLKDESYALILKNYYGLWYRIANYKLKNNFEQRDEAQRLINLYVAEVKTVQGEKWGFIDDKGNFIIEPKYDYAYDFQENGLAIVQVGNLYGIINPKGEYIVPPKYGGINQFSEGRAIVVDKDNFKVIDESGKEITKGKYNFIGSYNYGRAVFGIINTASGKELYGYLDREGKEVIPAKYENSNDFKDGKALVKIKDNSHGLIGLQGELLNSYSYYYVGSFGEGFLAFQQKPDGNYGYIDEKGNVIIKPQYTMALPFREGRAVINTSDGVENEYGLIDKTGKYIIKPQYNDINQLGENRVAVGKALDGIKPFLGSKYAIADTNGRFLTDFIYYNISNYDKGYASAYDNINTFFIDKAGNIARNFPIIKGRGTLSFIGNLIKASIDNRLAYYDKNGKLVWKQNTIVKLNDIYTVREEKFKPNKDYLVYFPQVDGMKNMTIEKQVNDRLKVLSQVKYIKPDEQLDYTYDGDFSIEFFAKNLLVLQLYGYQYYFGAAHGMPTKNYPHIDLVTGRFYELKDLFKKNSDYVKVLSNIIGEQIKNDPQYDYVFPDSYKGIAPNQPFYVDDSALYIYFAPYEIGPYAAGFPTFKIPYKEIMNIIDTNGDFWRSFHY